MILSEFEKRKCKKCGHMRIEHLFTNWSNCTIGNCDCLKFAIIYEKIKADKNRNTEIKKIKKIKK